MRALITRPEEDAAPLAEALAARHVAVTLEPMLSIRVLDDVAVDLDGVQAILFTSANGVRALAARTQIRDIGVLTVGDGTALAARAAGFVNVESAGGDVGDLIRLVRARLDPANGALFHAAGSVVAGDLAGQLAESGFELRRVVLYEARPAESLSPELQRALADREIDLVLFFSPRTAATFVELVGKADDPRVAAGCANAVALCLSPAVADAAGTIAWKAVHTAERPDLPGMLRLVDEVVPGPVTAAEEQPEAASKSAPEIVDSVSATTTRGRAGTGAAAAVAALVALAVTVLGLATAPLWQPALTGALPAPQTAAGDELRERVAALDAEAQALAERVAALDGMVRQLDARSAGAATDMADITGRIEELQRAQAALRADLAALQSAPAPAAAAAIPEDLAALPERVAALQSRLDAVAEESAGGPAPETAAAIDGLRGRLDSLQSTVDGVDARADVIEARLDALAALERRVDEIEQASSAAESRATGNAALAIAVNQFQAALAARRPFAAELATLTGLADGDERSARLQPALDALAPFAERGVPTLVELRQSFPAAAREAVAAARVAAGDESAAAEPGWLDAAMMKLGELVSVRPVGEDVEGDDAAARIARAEARLESDDLAGATQELDGLTGAAATAMAPWLAEARARLAAETAIAELQALAVSRLAPAASGG